MQAQLPYSLIIKSNFFFIHIFRIKSIFFWKGSFKTFHLLLSGLFTDIDVKYQRFIHLLLTDIYFQAQDIAFYFQHKILNPFLWFSFLMQIIIILTNAKIWNISPHLWGENFNFPSLGIQFSWVTKSGHLDEIPCGSSLGRVDFPPFSQGLPVNLLWRNLGGVWDRFHYKGR